MAFPDPKSGSGLSSNVRRRILSRVAAFYLAAENVFARLGRCCHTTKLSSDTATEDDFFEKVLL